MDDVPETQVHAKEPGRRISRGSERHINGVMQTVWAVIEGDGLTIMYPADY
jgi:hypothetical protein